MDPILVLYELSKKLKSTDSKILISSVELGKSLKTSQQTASRILRRMESGGLISRIPAGRSYEIQITEIGIELLNEIYTSIGKFFSKRIPSNIIRGNVTTGLGEGAYYVKEYANKFYEKLGFRPFFGTLNIKVNEKPKGLDRHNSIIINEFNRDGRTYGEVKILPVKLFLKNNRRIDCHLILPMRTHHENELEIISWYNIREKYKIKDNDRVLSEISG